jgi:hypothetical protein
MLQFDHLQLSNTKHTLVEGLSLRVRCLNISSCTRHCKVSELLYSACGADDLVWNVTHYVSRLGRICGSAMRNIVITHRDAREQATRHFFNRARRKLRCW